MAVNNTKGYVGRLLPFMQVSEQDTINQFSLDTVNERGTFVSIDSGNMDDHHGWDFESTPGASFAAYGIHSFNYEVKAKIRPCTSGDSKYNFLGVTLYNVATEDENGEKYKFYPQKAKEDSVILPGKAVPVGRRGVFTITSDAYVAVASAAVGRALVPSSTVDGKLDIVDAALVGKESTAGAGDDIDPETVVGKVIGVGTKFGGYVMIQLG